MPTANTGKARSNTRTLGSAAAFAGCIGLPDMDRGPRLDDGGLRLFCRNFNQRFDDLATSTRPEWRSFSRAEREARCL